LYIEDKWQFERYPIIQISFSTLGYREIPLDDAISLKLRDLANEHGLLLKSPSASLQFEELILQLSSKYNKKVIVLIDEYNKPLIDYLDPDNLHKAINNTFAHIPYDLWRKDDEHFYHAIIHLLFSLLGVYIQSEVHTKKGRADAVIQIEEGIFIFEFKLNQTAEAAIAQIKNRGYADYFKQRDKPVHLIGINFSSTEKAVAKLIWERG